ncbi:MAG: TIGR02117 family protein [Planctomycetales bacterium]
MEPKEVEPKEVEQRKRPSGWGIAKRVVGAMFKTLAAALILYAACCLIGMVPVNRSFRQAEQGVEVFVVSNGVHTEFILPAEHDVVDWRTQFPASDFQDEHPLGSHVSFGWGDRGFFIDTPSWSDLELITALQAMFVPSESVLRVGWTHRPSESDQCRCLTLTEEQYERLTEFIRDEFQRDAFQHGQEATAQVIPGARFSRRDAFYKARSSYHLFNTCNAWTGRGLKQTGVTTGLWTPFSSMVLYHLPEADPIKPQ